MKNSHNNDPPAASAPEQEAPDSEALRAPSAGSRPIGTIPTRDGGSEHGIADTLVHRLGLAPEAVLINTGNALDDPAVDWNNLASVYHHGVAGLQGIEAFRASKWYREPGAIDLDEDPLWVPAEGVGEALLGTVASDGRGRLPEGGQQERAGAKDVICFQPRGADGVGGAKGTCEHMLGTRNEPGLITTSANGAGCVWPVRRLSTADFKLSTITFAGTWLPKKAKASW